MRLISYIRVSDLGERDEDSESTQTIRQQREANEAIATLSNATIIDEVQALNASGGKEWPEPKLRAIIARVDAGEADGVVVYALDRWGRHLRALEVIERWADEGRTFLSASDKFDATTPSGRMCLRMMMVVARFYWEAARDRFMVSQRGALARGAHIARTPFGYERVTDERDPRIGCLVVDELHGPIIREAFRIAAGDGLHTAMAYLEREAPTRRWRTDDARRLLSNRAYLGEVHLGERVNADAHEPLTDPTTWLRAQTEPQHRRSNGDYPLSHLVHCERCGSGMVGALQSVNGRKYRRMRCSAPGCRGGSSISADKLEAHVRDVMAALLARKAFRDQFSPAGLGDAEAAMDAARAERRALTGKVKPSHPDFSAWLADADAAVDVATRRFTELSALTDQSETLPQAHELDDPEQFRRGLRALTRVRRIVIVPGRGDVAVRVKVERHDDVARALAA